MRNEQTSLGFFTRISRQIKLFSLFPQPGCITCSVVHKASWGRWSRYGVKWHLKKKKKDIILSCSSLPLAASSSLSDCRAANRRHSVRRTAAPPALFSFHIRQPFPMKKWKERKKNKQKKKQKDCWTPASLHQKADAVKDSLGREHNVQRRPALKSGRNKQAKKHSKCINMVKCEAWVCWGESICPL